MLPFCDNRKRKLIVKAQDAKRRSTVGFRDVWFGATSQGDMIILNILGNYYVDEDRLIFQGSSTEAQTNGFF